MHYRLGTPNTGDVSIRVDLLDNDDNQICSINWDGAHPQYEWFLDTFVGGPKDTGTGSYADTGLRKVKIVRSGSTITGYWYNPTTGAWTAMSDPATYSDDINIWLNGADSHGYTLFLLEAEGGLPNEVSGELKSFFSHRLENKVDTKDDLINMWGGLDNL